MGKSNIHTFGQSLFRVRKLKVANPTIQNTDAEEEIHVIQRPGSGYCSFSSSLSRFFKEEEAREANKNSTAKENKMPSISTQNWNRRRLGY